MAAAEWYEYDLVAVELLAVPAAVFADERAATISLRQALGSVEDEPQGRNVGAQRIVGDDSHFHQIGPLRLHARIEVLAVIAVRPAIERAVLHRSHVIRHEIGAEFVALVDDRPQGAALWLERQAVWVAESAREEPPAAGSAVYFPDGGAVLFRPNPFSVMLLFEPTPT